MAAMNQTGRSFILTIIFSVIGTVQGHASPDLAQSHRGLGIAQSSQNCAQFVTGSGPRFEPCRGLVGSKPRAPWRKSSPLFFSRQSKGSPNFIINSEVNIKVAYKGVSAGRHSVPKKISREISG
jgi:hypothetical protein